MRTIIFLLVLGFVPGLAFSDELGALTSRLNAAAQDKGQLNNILMAAKDRTTLCAYCHGTNGISNRPYIPNLAGQHPTYLLRELLHFADGTRKSDVMDPLAKKLTQQDMINISIYYSKMTAPNEKNDTQMYDARLVTAGKNVYLADCAQCHGTTGQGNKVFPRLSGQKIAYVVDTLKMFAAPNTDKNNPLLFDAVRSNPEMVNIVRKLKPADIRAVANFIATLH